MSCLWQLGPRSFFCLLYTQVGLGLSYILPSIHIVSLFYRLIMFSFQFSYFLDEAFLSHAYQSESVWSGHWCFVSPKSDCCYLFVKEGFSYHTSKCFSG
ncbi:hypothetical protein QVD17_30950 [Tagetes erecta]|uniref:Uncharacterized protein n=1 Tax=Tagetes erecta TaxID=13708 RepID=A0AAD8K4K6_TARER|nr:hypothetical protein QVD17_30950 [Tagetes erecta]